MAWDNDEDVRRYEGWFQTPLGRFALNRELALVDSIIAGWPRRGQSLIEIGCGTGMFLERFWRSGFDVTGLDKSQAMLRAAGRRLNNQAELRLGDAGHLPFDDDEFDFAALVTVLEFCDDPAEVLREAARVARKGVLVGFLNRLSLYGLSRTRIWPWGMKGALAKARWFSWPQLNKIILANVGHRAAKVRSVLPGPMWSWRETAPWSWLNTPIYPLYVGAFTAARIDLVDVRPLTPIHAWTTEPGMGQRGNPKRQSAALS